jgi:hypothetical protein
MTQTSVFGKTLRNGLTILTMAQNTHTFEIGEEFNGQVDDERMVIRGVTDNTVTYDYHVEGERIVRNTIEKETARTLIQHGAWKVPLTETAK